MLQDFKVDKLNKPSKIWPLVLGWRYAVLLLMVFGSLAFMLSKPPFGQNPHFHLFADSRAFLGVPNFMDVVSNIPFLLIGLAGIRYAFLNRLMALRTEWLAFFTGLALVCVGSAYYHLAPSNATLVWDRLPMTIGFMGLFVALLAEHVDVRLGKFLLPPALLMGFSSVIYWHWFDDLRFYYWVQLLPMLIVPTVMVLFPPTYSRRWLLLLALLCYVLAKLSESYDRDIFLVLSGVFSGHTLKHLLAAAGAFIVLVMLKTRQPRQPQT